jgi:D-sedoheptulose 7-phosphate isomerase
MKKTITEIFKQSIKAKQDFLSEEASLSSVARAAELIVERCRKGGKVIVFGNGGSAADAQHMAAEFVVRFEKERRALPCVALTTNTSAITACANDYDFDSVFKRQLEALAGPGDVAVAISTSGNSPNVIEAARAAREKGIPVIALTGRDGGKLAPLADVPIIVRNANTARVQEVHVLIIHAICKTVEDALA